MAHTTVVSQNSIWQVYFFFMLKYLFNPVLYIPWICSNLICFKVQMTLGVQFVGLDKPVKSIFEPEEGLNYFDKFMRLWTQNRISEITSVSNIWFDTVMLATWWTSKHSHMDHWIGCPTCVFTVAYAVLWLEVLLHIKVFHIRRTTTGGEEGPPTLSWKS